MFSLSLVCCLSLELSLSCMFILSPVPASLNVYCFHLLCLAFPLSCVSCLSHTILLSFDCTFPLVCMFPCAFLPSTSCYPCLAFLLSLFSSLPRFLSQFSSVPLRHTLSPYSFPSLPYTLSYSHVSCSLPLLPALPLCCVTCLCLSVTYFASVSHIQCAPLMCFLPPAHVPSCSCMLSLSHDSHALFLFL